MVVTVTQTGVPPSSATANCTGGVCSTSVNAPAGLDTFTVNLYDTANGTGNLLSSGSATVNIVAGQLNIVNLTFIGVPAAITMTLTPTTLATGNTAAASLVAAEVDADNNIIVGPPSTYPSPITISSSDTSGATSLSTNTVTSSTQGPITVTYSGANTVPSTVTFTSSATGVPPSQSASAKLSFVTGARLYAAAIGPNTASWPTLMQFITAGGLVQSLLGVTPLSTNLTTGTSLAVGPDGTVYVSASLQGPGPPTPTIWIIGGSGSQGRAPLNTSGQLATDGGGNLYVASLTGIAVYGPTASGNAAPLRTVNVPAGSIALDPTGNLYALMTQGQINVYPPNSSGNVAPSRSILAETGVSFGPMATDTSGNLYVRGALSGASAILVYPPGAQGAVAPNRYISGSSLQFGSGVAVDASGNIYAFSPYADLGGANANIQTFPPNASGNVAPVGTFALPSFYNYSMLASDPNSITAAGAPQGTSPAPVATFNAYNVNLTSAALFGLAPGPDGNVWFTDHYNDLIGKVTPTGAITTYALPGAGMGHDAPSGITTGPDHNLWSVLTNANEVAMITPTGMITTYSVSTPCCGLNSIASGPDGKLWFTASTNSGGYIENMTTTGGTTNAYATPSYAQPQGIAAGADGNLWAVSGAGVLRIQTNGTYLSTIPVTGLNTQGSIVEGPDHNIWVATSTGLASVTTSGVVTPVSIQNCCTTFTIGPDGFIYATLGVQTYESNEIGIAKVSTSGTVSYELIPPGIVNTNQIVGPDGNIWFLQQGPFVSGAYVIQMVL